MGRRDAALLVGLGAVWGAVYPLTSAALHDLSPPAVVVARTALSALVLLPLALRRGVLRSALARPCAVLVAALLQATIPLVLLTTGQQHVSAGLAGILLATQPVWTAILTILLERTLHLRQLAGVLIGLGGVALLFLRDLSTGSTRIWAGVALLAAAFFFAAGAVHIERVIPHVPPLATATAAMTISALVLAPFTAPGIAQTPDLVAIGWLFILGTVATGGALVLFNTLIHRVGAVRANLAGYLAPGFAVTYGIAFLDERATPEALAGLSLIIAGSYVTVTHRPSTSSTQRQD